MEIRSDLVKSAVMEYVEETFSGLEFSPGNVFSLMIAKMTIDNKLETLMKLVAKDNGLLPVDLLEKYGSEAMNKVGVIEIPKLDGKLLFRQEDFSRLIFKIKSKGEM